MIELLLLLIGPRLIRRKWWILGLIGLAWMALGVFFFIDAFVEEIRIPPTYFAIPLILDGTISLAAAVFDSGTRRPIRFAKGIIFIGIALLIIDAPWHSDMIIGLLAGAFQIADASWRTATAVVVRYARWPFAVFNAAIEFLFGLWSLVPWPTQWRGEVGSDVGTLLIVSAAGICVLSLRLRNLPPDMSMSTILTRGWPEPLITLSAAAPEPEPPERKTEAITVHVWTPTGALVPVRRGITRYVAALDERGVVSTGHAALELVPDLYISHYPAVEIERSQSDFARTLRATPDNNVPGLFQPSYQEESAGWCASTMQVRLAGLDTHALRDFWAAYRADTTYNLTNRNCSSAVAKALDAGLEGILEVRAHSPVFIARLLFVPELWIAGLMRRRAAAMAWTPGIVLDYARALSHIVRMADAEPRTVAPPGPGPTDA